MTCRFDAAVTRENVGQLREAQGQFVEAREVRRRGVKKGHMACGWYKVQLDRLCALYALHVPSFDLSALCEMCCPPVLSACAVGLCCPLHCEPQ